MYKLKLMRLFPVVGFWPTKKINKLDSYAILCHTRKWEERWYKKEEVLNLMLLVKHSASSVSFLQKLLLSLRRCSSTIKLMDFQWYHSIIGLREQIPLTFILSIFKNVLLLNIIRGNTVNTNSRDYNELWKGPCKASSLDT